ncbi:MAG: DUF4190 domain-containing protein [Verrucomicrobiota bacterium]|nr:DUF4190 domain-containing protein [Verrucomicrobiota bacterium]
MVMRNPEPTEPIEVEETVETKPEPPVMEEVEESTNGEQAEQPPLIEKPTSEVQEEVQTASPPQKRVSALAVVSAVSSSLGFLGVTSLLGLGLGIVALKQMAVNPQLSGRHLAIFGVCLSAFWLVLLLAMGSVLWVGMSLMKDLINTIF